MGDRHRSTHLSTSPLLSSPSMSMSGVAINEECMQAFQDLKLGKKMKYLVFEIAPSGKEIIVTKRGDSKSYDDFVYEFEYEKGEGIRNKLCFYAWSPDTAPVRKKMVYASSKDALRRAFVGIAHEIQGTDFSEISYDAVLDKVSKGA